MSRRNMVIAYFIGILISVGFPAFGGGRLIEPRPRPRPHPHPHPSYPSLGEHPIIVRPDPQRPPIYW
jgi:hypothetical protein